MSTTSTSPKRKRGRPRGSRSRTSLMPLPVVPPVTMRAPDAAAHVGVSLSLMKRWIAEEKVKSVAIGRVRLVFVDSLHRLIGAA